MFFFVLKKNDYVSNHHLRINVERTKLSWTGETEIGKTGILITSDIEKLTFPKPIKIEGNIITGENYIIELNRAWTVKQIDKKGNLEIVKK